MPLYLNICSSSFSCDTHQLVIHSFPTRRSSDLGVTAASLEILITRAARPSRTDADNAPSRALVRRDRKSTRLNSSLRHLVCRPLLEKKKSLAQYHPHLQRRAALNTSRLTSIQRQ